MTKFNYINILSALFIPIPFLLITGPFLPDLFVSTIVVIYLFYSFKYKSLELIKNKYFYVFLIFCSYLIINSFFNNTNFTSIKISLAYFRYGIFIIAVIFLINENEKVIRYFFYSLIFSFSILVFDGLLQYIMGENIFGFKLVEPYRISSFFNDELILGSYLSRLTPLLLGMIILLNFSKFIKFYSIIIIVLTELVIFFSGERVAFFFINLSLIYFFLLSKDYKKIWILVFIFSFSIISFFIYTNKETKSRIIDHTIEQFDYQKNYNVEDPEVQKDKIFGIYVFSVQHTHHYLTAYKMFLDHKIFGVGVKNFRKYCDNEKYKISDLSCSTHPHNFYFQILAEIGAAGFLLILFVFCMFLYFSIKQFIFQIMKKPIFDDFQIALLSGILIYLWPFSPNGNFFNNWLTIIHCLTIAFFIWSFSNRTKKNLNFRE